MQRPHNLCRVRANLVWSDVVTRSHSILWAGTPIVTWPRHRSKFCSRVAASIVASTGLADQMVVSSEAEYEARAVALARSVSLTQDASTSPPMPRGHGELYDLRKRLFTTRESLQLFDTVAWTRNVERGYFEAWRRWVVGTEFEDSPEVRGRPDAECALHEWLSHSGRPARDLRRRRVRSGSVRLPARWGELAWANRFRWSMCSL
jgi:hypothetical protein